MIVKNDTGYSVHINVPDDDMEMYGEIVERLREYDMPMFSYTWDMDNAKFVFNVDMPIIDPEVPDDVAYDEIMGVLG